jgi:hypothetical protein
MPSVLSEADRSSGGKNVTFNFPDTGIHDWVSTTGGNGVHSYNNSNPTCSARSEPNRPEPTYIGLRDNRSPRQRRNGVRLRQQRVPRLQ